MNKFWNEFFERSFDSKVNLVCAAIEESCNEEKSEYINSVYLLMLENSINDVISSL